MKNVWQAILRQFLRYVRSRVNPKTDLTLMRYCSHFFIKAEGGAKYYKRDHTLPLAWRSFTVSFVRQKGNKLILCNKINIQPFLVKNQFLYHVTSLLVNVMCGLIGT